ncbi:hypothetical protein EDB81DRAFT_785796 [Dactylonectria macrodidyma]|uniref:Flavin-nucleotide-binding protein n=1 Tax=Dactylonectria macrodidyma TaxID=307937 RepID=A0A9P9JCV8_9HYPO|nr:hypothetical protein EDB81DRAFT_785796 [Dactylonectria macrodidyma]
MGVRNLEYPKETTNTVKRYNAHAVYALETIHRIVNSSQILHVSFNTPSQPFPVTLPMIGQMGSFDRPSADLGDPLELYLHGYVSSRLMNTCKDSTSGDSTPAGPKGMPVCIAASHVDGLVLTLTSYSHNYNYRSSVLFGYATHVTDEEEKLYAMELITNSVVPDRWRHTRLPPTKAEIQSTGILKVRIASGSAKISAGQASDDKSDMANEAMLDSTWTGVLPIYQTMGAPVPSSYNRVDLPDYVSEFANDYNTDNMELSLDAAKGERRAL